MRQPMGIKEAAIAEATEKKLFTRATAIGLVLAVKVTDKGIFHLYYHGKLHRSFRGVEALEKYLLNPQQ